MKKRQIIVNRKFQFGLAATFAGLSAAIMMAIIIILSWVLAANNVRLKEVNKNQHELSTTQTEIFKTLMMMSDKKNMEKLRISVPDMKRDSEKTEVLLVENNGKIKEIISVNGNIIIMLVISAILQSAIIFYLMLKRSHRISGPLFLLNRYINDLRQGAFPEVRPLRSRDDFQDVFNNFRDLIEILKNNSINKKR